jgi:hypothetical protein
VELHGRLQFASSFAANGAPALVCLIELEQEVHMQVRDGSLDHSAVVPVQSHLANQLVV